MTWVNAILLLLKAADTLIGYLRNKQQLDAGADHMIAQATASILAKTQTAKQIMGEVSGMTDEQVDKALKELEP